MSDLSTLDRQTKLKILSLAATRKRSGKTAYEEEDRERLKWIERCRVDLGSWAVEALKPEGFEPALHHKLLIKELEDIAEGRNTRLMVFMPPGSAKSRYCSQLFPAWMLQRRKRFKILGACHTTGLAEDFSDKIQTLIRDNQEVLGYGLRTEAKHRWYTTNGGAYMAAGVGTAIPGFRSDLGIVDDPVKGRQAADSEVDRKAVWDWYIGSFERRLTPGAPVIIILTRWHEDDLAGRLLSVHGNQDEGGQWRVLDLPAEAEEDDPLGREPGDWLWDDDAWGYGAELEKIRDNLEMAGETREWSSQYQQRPRPRDGSIFKRDRIGTLQAPPSGGKIVRAYDLAATKDTGTRGQAWTRGVKMLMTPDRRIVVVDMVGCRGGPDEVEQLIRNTAMQDGKKVRIGLPQDPGQSGKFQVSYLTKSLHGYRVSSSPESGDKATRAMPFASQVNVGNVDVVEGAWNKAYLDELASFPSGATKDQVDASSRAYEMLVEQGRPLILSPQALKKVETLPKRNRFSGVTGRNRFGRAR